MLAANRAGIFIAPAQIGDVPGGTVMGIAVVKKWVRLLVATAVAAWLALSFMHSEPNDHGARIDNARPQPAH